MDRAAFILILAVLVLSPLPFGSVHTYAYTLLFVLILAASLLLLAHNLLEGRGSRPFSIKLPDTPFSPLFLLMLIFLIIQIVPLPGFLIGLLNPEAIALNPDVSSLAPYVHPVRLSLVRWIVYGFFFYALLQTLNSRKRIELTLIIILLSAAINSLYGIYGFYLGANRVWWVTKLGQTVSGTFLNRNHFGAFMALAILLGVTYLFAIGRQRDSGGHLTWRQQLIRSLTNEQLFGKRIFIASCVLAAGLGLILSASRGAILALAVSLPAFLVPYFQNKKQRRRILLIGLALAAVIAGASQLIGKDDTWKRFGETDAPMASRVRYTSQSIKLFADYPLTGVGFGNFQYAFPRYQSPEDTRQFIEHAHNDWVQLLAEGGLAGFSLFLAGAIFYIRALLRQWRVQRDPFARTMGTLSLTAIIYMAVHSLFDFNLHVPANVLLFIAMQAIGLAAMRIRERRSRTRYPYWLLPLKGRGGIVSGLLLVLILWAGGTAIRHFAAETYCNSVLNTTLKRDPAPPSKDIQEAIAWDGGNSAYWFKLAGSFQEQRKEIKPTNEFDIRQQEVLTLVIRNLLEQAIRLNPFSAAYLETLGWEYTSMWRAPDFEEKWLPRADQAMEKAELLAGDTFPKLLLDIGNYWIYRSKRSPEGEEDWQHFADKAAHDYSRSYLLEENDKKKEIYSSIMHYVTTMYPGDSLMSRKIREGLGER
ncbi:MAG: O-antigen ligase family protein [Desulfobacterales bacterium]|nr:O-antigen ligase family protein [Desulfobacterales bacterium]